jgi:magnesium transporter
VTSILETNLII